MRRYINSLKARTRVGRIGRLRYLGYSIFWGILLAILVGILLAGIESAKHMSLLFAVASAIGIGVPLIIAITALFIELICLQIRRLHDFNCSGWWCLLGWLLGFIPYVGVVWSIAILFIPGTKGPNRFGPQPQ